MGHSGAALPLRLDRSRTQAGARTCTRRSRPFSRPWAARSRVRRRPTNEGEGISIGGEIIHELGTVRMGNDPATSVLNKYCQAHEVKNLFVADAAPFVSNPDKNPTLTIIALAWRTAEYLAEEMRKGNV